MERSRRQPRTALPGLQSHDASVTDAFSDKKINQGNACACYSVWNGPGGRRDLGSSGLRRNSSRSGRCEGRGGKYFDVQGNPTFKIISGSTDWYTYSGYRRYHSECHVCHGPDGEGSSYAPALKNSVKAMSYGEFIEVVASGRKNVNASHSSVMPAFGDNPNVACYMDDLYVYLRARGADAVGRVRPARHDDKPSAAREAEDSCMGTKK